MDTVETLSKTVSASKRTQWTFVHMYQESDMFCIGLFRSSYRDRSFCVMSGHERVLEATETKRSAGHGI